MRCWWTRAGWSRSWTAGILHTSRALSFDECQGPVLSTEAVLADAARRLAPLIGGTRTCIDFFLGAGAVLVPSSRAALRRTRQLVIEHSALPMGYVDATLVSLAEELGTNLVLTADRRSFGRYRLYGHRSFRILPSASLRADVTAPSLRAEVRAPSPRP